MEKDIDVNYCNTCTIRCGLPNELCPLSDLSYDPVRDMLYELAEASKKLTDEEILKHIDDTKKIWQIN